MAYFDKFNTSPYAVIHEVFGDMRTIDQNDIKSTNGTIIDMNFFRETGLPACQNWVMKDWNIEFNCVCESIPSAVAAFSNHSIDLLSLPIDNNILKYLNHCLCLDLFFCTPEKDSFDITCLDLSDLGAITSVYSSLQKNGSSNNTESNVLFINSSIEQFIKTLALYTVHHDRPADMSYNESVKANEMFGEYVKRIDKRAMNDKTETFWGRVLDDLANEDI